MVTRTAAIVFDLVPGQAIRLGHGLVLTLLEIDGEDVLLGVEGEEGLREWSCECCSTERAIATELAIAHGLLICPSCGTRYFWEEVG